MWPHPPPSPGSRARILSTVWPKSPPRLMAETLESKIDSFERFDRMLASSEARRNNALREIDRHREALGAATRQAVNEIEDAQFRDVETGAVNGETLS